MTGLGIIDAHQHCWQLARPECSWPTPDLRAIYRDFGPQDFWREAAPRGVVGSVLVQSQPNEADTDYLLTLAERWPSILGVVGWTDLTREAAPGRIRALAQNPWLKGLRPMLQALPEDDWILHRANPDALSAMAVQGLVFDALVCPRHLPVLLELARRHPDLTIVIDHGAKPDIARGGLSGWQQGLKALASCPRVYCKLSGLVIELAPGQPWEELLPYLDSVLEIFGPERVLWGSDWPVLNLAGDYSRWLTLAWHRVNAGTPGQEVAVFRDNARAAYGLAI